jgi:hypothetical protein
MSCWVVPSVAAELWGVPIELVLYKAYHGQVPSREENGFTFVDVAPDSPVYVPNRPELVEEPQTWTTVTPEELAALISDNNNPVHDSGSAQGASDQNRDDTRLEETLTKEELEALQDLGDYRKAREHVSTTRRPPAFKQAS